MYYCAFIHGVVTECHVVEERERERMSKAVGTYMKSRLIYRQRNGDWVPEAASSSSSSLHEPLVWLELR